MNRVGAKQGLPAQRLLAILEPLLITHPKGISEYALLKYLQNDAGDDEISSHLSLTDPFSMFQSHFLLFHALYHLRQQWRASGQGDISIHTLKIQAIAYTPISNKSPVVAVDPLAAYYLDWQNLLGTTTEDVNQLLKDFWLHFDCDENALANQHFSKTDPQLELSYAVLKLPFNSSPDEVKRQYHKLLHQFHPDKGGDTPYAQTLQIAYAYIRRCG
ncbi:DNA-J related domain-containing protein [Paraglaciecola sp. 20A4]|uniref:DNA-J related domain-containing protein n=1 Tax=Paraglaciecola sp. 20A4 TaxID=2687288 RepID=UPI001F109DCC|nr:DNA-J related domain-containing protein [Paraglaciecola sp. 20A4]